MKREGGENTQPAKYFLVESGGRGREWRVQFVLVKGRHLLFQRS
jgi:hypothetical protein